MRRLPFVLAAFLVGAPLVAGACSTPAPIPAGAWVLTFNHSGPTCQLMTHNDNVGMIDASSAGTLVTDGVSGASVTCTVKGSGTFSVDGEVLANGSNLRVVIPSITSMATPMAPVMGTVSYISPMTQNIFTSPQGNCNFYFSDPKETVSAGTIFVSFDCPEVDNGMQMCSITGGHIKVTSCTGTPSA